LLSWFSLNAKNYLIILVGCTLFKNYWIVYASLGFEGLPLLGGFIVNCLSQAIGVARGICLPACLDDGSQFALVLSFV
jgi:hypothetical protein